MRSIASIIFVSLILWPCASAGDIIYFKDGMRTICQGRAWEEKDEVKCDYDGVLLTYRREDVEHIHKTFLPEETDEAQPSETPTGPVDSEPPAVEQSSNSGTAGPPFYDPRRAYKYWSSKSVKHHTYRDAIDALAKEFKKPSLWVEKRIGVTNDLEQIRKRLSQPDTVAVKVAVPSSVSQAASGILFYNPRREYKYQISADQKYHTYEEAIAALAAEYKSTPQWVEEHMGEKNDIAAIRDLLGRSKADITENHQ